jgi:hypothetical protein
MRFFSMPRPQGRLALLLMCACMWGATSAGVQAQSAAGSASGSSGAAAASRPGSAAAAPNPARAPARDTARERADNRSAQRQTAAGATAAQAALTPGELDVARRVETGRFPCELGQAVEVQSEGRTAGMFIVTLGNQRFRMQPVETTTGALRLEDPQRGGVWLQLANKSMLMNQKLGRRLADECMSPQQVRVADAMKNAPPVNILEPAPPPPPPVTPAAAAAVTPQVVVTPVRPPGLVVDTVPGARD